MSSYETLTLLTSVLAVIISAVALYRGHRLGQKQVELQRAQADLATLQHKLIVRAEQGKARADIRAAFTGSGTRWRMIVENVGPATARNLRLADSAGRPNPEPLIASECERYFPLRELRPGQSVSLIAALHLGIQLPVVMIFTWDDERGQDQQCEVQVARL